MPQLESAEEVARAKVAERALERLKATDQQLDHLLAAIEIVESRWGQPAVRIDESLARLYGTAEQIRNERKAG